MAVAAEDLAVAMVLEMDLAPKAAPNLDRMMDPAKATEVPRDTRMAVVPRVVPTPRATRAVEEDPVRGEDPIPGDISLRREARARNLDLDRMMEMAMEGMGAPRDLVAREGMEATRATNH